MLRVRICPLWALLVSAGAGAAPGGTAPSAVINVAGVWNGRYQEEACTSACCEPSCSARFKGGPPTRDFTLTLSQQDARVSGRFEEGPAGASAPLSGSVSGQVNGRMLTLSGHLTWQSPTFPNVGGSSDLLNFTATVDDAGRRLGGTFVLLDHADDGSEFLRRTSGVRSCSLRERPLARTQQLRSEPETFGKTRI